MKDRDLAGTVVGAGVVGIKGNGVLQLGMRWRSLAGLGLGMALLWSAAGCHKSSAQNAVGGDVSDPASANMAPVSASGDTAQPAQVLAQNAQYTPQQQSEDYQQQQAAPIERRAPDGSYSDPNADNDSQQQAQDAYDADLTEAQASDPPPPLPDYEQPYAPGPDYIWTPGYWAWSPDGYYWVPGAWVEPPYSGGLWTPGYWGYTGGYYRFHHGFWGLHIGFYGGINYGFGYTGYGYDGGYWNGGHFFYNTRYNRVNVTVVHNVYMHNGGDARFAGGVSFNGGRGGLRAAPRPAEIAVLHEQRNAPMPAQEQLRQQSAQNKQQFYNQNRGRPAVAAAASPIVSDHRMPAALPRAAAPQAMPAARGPQPGGAAPFARPGQAQPDQRGPQAQPQTRPAQAQPGFQNRPQAQPDQRGPQAQPQYRAQPQAQPQTRTAQPEAQPQPTRPEYRPQERQAQPQPQPQPQAQPQQTRPQYRPQPQTQPQAQPQFRPQPQPQARPAPPPQPQARPAPQPQPQARPAPQPQPQARPAEPQHQAPVAHPQEDKKDDRGHM